MLLRANLRSVSSIGLSAVATVMLIHPSPAQTAETQSNRSTVPPSFDVSSVKLSHAGDSNSSSTYVNGRFTATNTTLKGFMQYAAYGIPDERIIGGPKWLDSERFDIEAKMEPSVIDQLKKLNDEQRQDQMHAMFQQLLSDRFHLQAHWEKRELPIYALVVAKNGPKLQPPKYPDQGSGTSGGNGMMSGNNLTLPEIAQLMTQDAAMELGRIVLDRTKIAGHYDFRLKWTPDANQNLPGDSSSDVGPSLFTAVQEQLGLKLEPSKGPVQVLVIDRVEMPSAN